MNLAVCGTWG